MTRATKSTLVAASALSLFMATPAIGHQVDEYVQATTISIEKNRVEVQMRLTPGVAVFRTVRDAIDTDGDGKLSASEQRAYAEHVLRDLSLTIDGEPLHLRLVSCSFADIDDLRDGRGAIRLVLDAAVPTGNRNRRLVFVNQHEMQIGAYLVNALVPHDPDIQLGAQQRDYSQLFYQLDYVQASGASPAFVARAMTPIILPVAAVLLLAGLALVWARANGAHRLARRLCHAAAVSAMQGQSVNVDR